MRPATILQNALLSASALIVAGAHFSPDRDHAGPVLAAAVSLVSGTDDTSAAVTAARQPTTDTTGPTAPGDLSAWDFGCETWLFWNESVDDVDPQHAIRYEVRVNGVVDGAQTGIDRWITYGTQTSNTFSVQAVDSAGNRSPASSVTLTSQTC